MWLGLAAIFFLVLVTAFFVASEFALVSIRKTRVEQLVSEGRPGAKQAKYAIEHLQEYIAAAQVGITMASLGLGALGEPVVAEAIFRPLLEGILPHDMVEQFISLHGIAIVLAFIVVTVIEIVMGETVPKIIAIQNPDRTMLLIVVPLNFFVFIFKPLTWMINASSNAVLRLIRLDPKDEHANVYSVEELEMLVVSSRQAGVLEKEEEAILRRVFDLGDLSARQVMVPRTEITGIPVDASISEVIAIMEREKHSRFPVYQDDLDNILGALHVKDMFLAITRKPPGQPDRGELAFNVRNLVREILKVPQSLSVNDLLAQMRARQVHIAVIIDEYGGTAGMVTLEDILEEIVGEVRDEFEVGEEPPDFVTTPEGTQVNGLTSIDDVNEQLGLRIETEADTIGGYVFELLGRKPELGDEVSDGHHRFGVAALDGLRIAEVRVIAPGRARAPAPVRDGEEE